MIEEPQVVEIPAQLVATIHVETPRSKVQEVMGPGISEAMAAVQEQGIGPAGPWFAHHLKMTPEVFDGLAPHCFGPDRRARGDERSIPCDLVKRGRWSMEDLERIRLLFSDLETQTDVIELLTRAEGADGVRIFIGSENKLFSLSGSSTIIAPYSDAAGRIVGVLGVIGPTRLNYARVIPTVDYAARIVSRMLGG